MTAVATRLHNPHRQKALAYLRDGRLTLSTLESPGRGQPATFVEADVEPAPGDPSGYSVWVTVRLDGGVWSCDGHPGEHPDACAHVYAAQLVTGHSHRGGRWRV